MAKIFENAPSHIVWAILILVLVNAVLYLDNAVSGYTNPIIFFISVVIIPLLVASMSGAREKVNILKFMGFEGTLSFAISMLLMGAGAISMVFFFLIRPMAILFEGTAMYSSILFLFLPLSSQSMWFTTLTPLFSLIFYLVIAFGEEIMKITVSKITANWINVKTGGAISKTLIISAAFLIALIGWIFCHWLSWGGVPLVGMMMGIFLSIIFISPLMVAEPIMSPESGYDTKKLFNIWAPIGGHFFYDFLLTLMTNGQLPIDMFGGVILSVFLIGGGGALLLYQHFRKIDIGDFFRI